MLSGKTLVDEHNIIKDWNKYLKAPLKIPATKSPGSPGNLPSTSITKYGTIWSALSIIYKLMLEANKFFKQNPFVVIMSFYLRTKRITIKISWKHYQANTTAKREDTADCDQITPHGSTIDRKLVFNCIVFHHGWNMMASTFGHYGVSAWQENVERWSDPRHTNSSSKKSHLFRATTPASRRQLRFVLVESFNF